MNRKNGALVEYSERSSGNAHRHNFVNRYLPDEELRKPSHNVSSAISSATQKQIDNIVGAKTQPAYVSVFVFFHFPYYSCFIKSFLMFL